jgi:hypothetical protein
MLQTKTRRIQEIAHLLISFLAAQGFLVEIWDVLYSIVRYSLRGHYLVFDDFRFNLRLSSLL